MSGALERRVARLRAALMAGEAGAALAAIDDLTRTAARRGLDEATRAALEPVLEELRALAQASLRGARQGAEQVRAIVEAARSLQTYDCEGRRTVNETRAPAAQRF